MAKRIDARKVNAFFGEFRAIAGVSLAIEPNKVTALIGPSGCGKSTFLRTLNRMHEEIAGAKVVGTIRLDDVDIYDDGVSLTEVRRSIGMVFQRPNPFLTMSVKENVVSGLRLAGVRDKDHLNEVAETTLKAVGLWEEVKNRLDRPGTGLSGGQQQRLCIARAVAVDPDVILMDEPCSALDPISTLRIEDLMTQLKEKFTVVVVTHNMQQAARVSDTTAFFNIEETGAPGRLIEVGETSRIFTSPEDSRTEAYITGRFG